MQKRYLFQSIASTVRVVMAGLVIFSLMRTYPVHAIAGNPDLVITAVTAAPVSTGSDDFTVEITVQNQGGDDYELGGDNPDRVYRDIYVDTPPTFDTDNCHFGNPAYDDDASTIPSGGSQTRTIAMNNLSPGIHTLYIYVDVNCSVDEVGEPPNSGNNSWASFQITVGDRVDVELGGTLKETYYIPTSNRVTPIYAGENRGPLRVVSPSAAPLITSERAYRGANLTDFKEIMGFPSNQLTTEYWFPWYDSTSFMQTYLVISNASTDSVNQPVADVDVYVAGQLEQHFEDIPYGGREVYFDPGVQNGPVRVVSTNGTPIITSERAYRGVSDLTDFNEMVGFPANKLTTEYWFSWYDSTSFMQTYIVIGNASADAINQPSANVDVYVAGQLRQSFTNIPYGGRAVYYEAGVQNGPVRIVSTNGTPIITSERSYRGANLTDFNEIMGFPASGLTTEYWFPWYDSTSFMQTYLVIGNASTDSVNQPPANVSVYVAGQLRQTFTSIPYGGRQVYYDAGIQNGPVRIVSTNGVNIITSERAYRGPNLTDFNELMGFPSGWLTNEYWFPWYAAFSFMQTYLVVGNAR